MSEQKFHTIDHEIRETLERFRLSLNTDAKLSLNHSQIKNRQMKITDVKTFPYNGPFNDLVFVKVETDQGMYGWGEAGGMGCERACEATVQEINPYFIGQDPGQIELLWNTVYRDAYRRPDDTLLNARECDSVWHSPGRGFPDPNCC